MKKKVAIALVIIVAAVFGVVVYAQQGRPENSGFIVYQTCDGGILTSASQIQAVAESMKAQGCDTLHFRAFAGGQFYAYGETAVIFQLPSADEGKRK